MTRLRTLITTLGVLALALTATPVLAASNDDQQAPRSQDEQQAPRGQDTQAPRAQHA